METLQEQLLRLIDQSLSLGGRGLHFDGKTRLMGALPELDSMAVVALIGAVEEHFGIRLPDDEIDGSTFATVGAFTAFVASQVGRDG